MIRGWHIALGLAAVLGLLFGWGAFVLAYLFGWWASYIFLGGLHGGIRIRRPSNPLSGFGEEPMPRVEREAEDGQSRMG